MAAPTLQASQISIGAILNYIQALDLGQASDPLSYSKIFSFTGGTGANQADVCFHDTRTLAASASEDIDLNGTAFKDAFGNNVAITKLKALIIYSAPGNTNDVVVGGTVANQITSMVGPTDSAVKVKPGGILVLIAPDANGYAVTAATAHLLQIANGSSGTSVSYDIIALGV